MCVAWRKTALRKVINPDKATLEQFPEAYQIVNTAPEGTTVTTKVDISGLLVVGGEGDGNDELSFAGVVLAEGFMAQNSRLAVAVTFQVMCTRCVASTQRLARVWMKREREEAKGMRLRGEPLVQHSCQGAMCVSVW